MELLCNIFNGIYDLDCLNVVKVNSVLSGIKNGRWKERIEYLRSLTDKTEIKLTKEKLPCVTFAGVFEIERKDEACVHYSQLMVVDIDKIDEKRLKSLKNGLRSNPYVYAFFDSPRHGLKILIPIDSDIKKHNTDAFYCIEKMFMDMYGIKIDKSGKNISRLCFVSYDPDLYFNPNCQVFHIEDQPVLQGFEILFSAPENFIPSTDADYIFKTCIKMVKKSKTGSYHKGNRNNFIFCLSCLMCEFGVSFEQSLGLIFGKYDSLGFPEVKNTVASAFKRNKHIFATKFINQRIDKNQTLLL